jgi:hypothetical protein
MYLERLTQKISSIPFASGDASSARHPFHVIQFARLAFAAAVMAVYAVQNREANSQLQSILMLLSILFALANTRV